MTYSSKDKANYFNTFEFTVTWSSTGVRNQNAIRARGPDLHARNQTKSPNDTRRGDREIGTYYYLDYAPFASGTGAARAAMANAKAATRKEGIARKVSILVDRLEVDPDKKARTEVR
jgi:hypothetical protein